MTLRQRLVGGGAVAIFLAISTLAVAQVRATAAAKIGCVALGTLRICCEVHCAYTPPALQGPMGMAEVLGEIVLLVRVGG